MNRRNFLKGGAGFGIGWSLKPDVFTNFNNSGVVSASTLKMGDSAVQTKSDSLIMGGPVLEKYEDPDDWTKALKRLGYRAAYCPVDANAGDELVNAYVRAAQDANIVIAEVGAWSNPISRDNKERNEALKKCRRQLELAERIGALCCVNISGSRGEKWDGPSPDNLTDETFDIIVETTRAIIDDVKPIRTYFALETMPWAYPDSTDSYARLIKAVDRKRFAVHFDPVNLVCSPQRYYRSGDLIQDFFKKLGPMIKSCHAKDIILHPTLTTHLDEIRPGLGGLDYSVYLKELSKFPDTPLMLEHLRTQEEYNQAAEHIRNTAHNSGLSFR